ncbi:MAG TPA: YceI family protein [Acidobacteriaceae bacterium]
MMLRVAGELSRNFRGYRSGALFWAAIVLTVPSARAQQPVPFTVVLNPGQTSIHWTLNTTLHTVHGTFKLNNGSFHVDTATGDVTGAIVIDATSGESGDSARDRRMHGAVLESERYPEITYRPAHVSGRIDLASGSDVTVDGTFRLHGADHALQLIVHLRPDGTAAKLSTRFSIPFVAWGLKDPSTFVFRTDKQVTVDVDATFTPAPDRSAARPVLHPGEVHTAQ